MLNTHDAAEGDYFLSSRERNIIKLRTFMGSLHQINLYAQMNSVPDVITTEIN